ncbi:MAG: TRAP transporter substrate-binding protein [Rectinemataceae bacterium]
MKKLVIIMMLAILAGSAFGQAKVLMRVGDIENISNLGAIALDRFADSVAKQSGGDFEVRAFHASQLGEASKQLELVKSGALQAFRCSISWLADFDTGFSLTDFPFTAGNPEQAKAIANSPGLQKLNEKLAKEHGIRFVTAGWTRLPRQILLSKPIKSVEDLKGVKLRVPGAYSYIQSFKALGATPTPVAFAETYLALKQGVVDGAENHVESLYNMKWYESAKHLVITDHSYDITGFMVNDAWWKKLTEAQRKMVVDTFYEVDQWFIKENENLQQYYIDLMVKEGVKVYKLDKESFRRKVYPMVMEQAERDGEWQKGLWAEVQALLK